MRRSIAVVALASALAMSGTAYVAHGQGVVFQKGQAQGELAIVRLAGTRIYNAKAEAIGTVSEVVLGADGRATTVVINVGGVAGVGAKQVGVPYAALKVGPVVESSRVLLIDVTTAQLQAAPAYIATDPGRLERARKKAGDWFKVAKDKVYELGKQAGEAVEKMQQPEAKQPAPPAPKQ